ncbi:MAG TPA: hypothetical protein VHR64_02935 [Thermomicrobiales bacterium]|nr:hypothetical protein [Thermomicrobiales bacterium]
MGWPEAVVASVSTAFFFAALAVGIVWVMKVGAKKAEAEASSEHTMMVRSLAEEATASQRTVATELTEVRLAMAEIRDRLAAIERMMTEVG